MAGEIDQYVDSIFADPFRERLIGEPMHVAPLVNRCSQPPRGFILEVDVAVAHEFETAMLVRCNERFAKEIHRMLAEVWRNISDPQSPVRRAIVRVRKSLPGQRFGVPAGPLQMLVED